MKRNSEAKSKMIVTLIIGCLASIILAHHGSCSGEMDRANDSPQRQGQLLKMFSQMRGQLGGGHIEQVSASSGVNPILVDSLKLSLPKAKPNKVSKLMHYVYDKTGNLVYDPPKWMSEKDSPTNESPDSTRQLPDDHHPEHNSLRRTMSEPQSDNEVIASACDNSSTKKLCNSVVTRVLQGPDEAKANLAMKLRSKPPQVQASKILYHDSIGHGIQRMEEKGYDVIINGGLDLAIARHPLGMASKRVINALVK